MTPRAGSRARRARTGTPRQIRPSQWRRALVILAAGDDESGAARDLLRTQPAANRADIDAAILDVLAKVKGPQVETLVGILDEHGQIDAAMRQLNSVTAARRAGAVRALGLMRVRAEIPRVAKALDDAAVLVVTEAVTALGRLAAVEHVPGILASALPRAQGFHRPAQGVPLDVVADAIAAIGPDALGGVRAALVGPDTDLAVIAAGVVQRASLTRLVPTVRGLLLIEDRTPVVVALVGALGHLGGRRDTRYLLRIAQSALPEPARIAAIEAMAALGDPACCGELGDLMADQPRLISTSAASALARLGDRGIDELERHALRSGPSSAVAAYELSVRGVRRSHA